MFRKTALTLLLFFFIGSVYAQKLKPRSVIFDSDMGPDYDDVGAITLLHAFADSGYVKILATVASTKYDNVAAVLNTFNTYFKRPDIPIGIPQQNGLTLRDGQHWSDTVVNKYPHKIKSNQDVPDAVEVYRKVLAKQPDHSVTIITVGFFTNLANLLQSGKDKYADLTGEQLINKKVKNIVSMAGRFPAGKEFNVEKDAASSQYVFNHLTVPVLFSGFEIGEKIKVGIPLINNKHIINSPVKDCFRISIPMAKGDSDGRMSWDETAVLVGSLGYQKLYTVKEGTFKVAPDGANNWINSGNQHSYLVEKVAPIIVQQYIENTIQNELLKQNK